MGGGEGERKRRGANAASLRFCPQGRPRLVHSLSRTCSHSHWGFKEPEGGAWLWLAQAAAERPQPGMGDGGRLDCPRPQLMP